MQVLDAGIAGPPGTPDVTVPVDPYPSDHRGGRGGGAARAGRAAVVRVGAATGAWSAATRSRVRYAAPRGGGRERLAIVRAGGRPGGALMTLPPQEASFYGAVTFGSGGLEPGRYDALLVDARRPTCCRAARSGSCGRDARPRMRVRAARPRRPRDPASRGATRRRTGATGSAIWKAGDPDLYNGYLTFAYTGATVAGATRDRRRRADVPARAATSRGCCSDDGYGVLAQARFTVARALTRPAYASPLVSEPFAIAQVTPHPWEDEHEVNAFVRSLADGLAARGHRIVVLAPSRSPELVRESRRLIRAGEFFDPDGGVRVLGVGRAAAARAGAARARRPRRRSTSRARSTTC